MTTPAIEELTDEESWSLLASTDIGRIAVSMSRGSGIDIFPINYGITGRIIYFASAPGSKLLDIASDATIAFEADSFGAGARWSVVVKGQAHRLNDDREIQSSGVKLIASASPAEKWNYVRIEPASVTGRRFTKRAPQAAGPASVPPAAAPRV